MISHKRKTIFIHIPKCGGVSVERLFVSDMGLEWNERAPLLLRERWADEPAPDRLAHLVASDYVHRGYVSHDEFCSYFKFTVIRHPRNRTESAYRYLGFHRVMGFDRFVMEYLTGAVTDSEHPLNWFLKPQWDFIADSTQPRLSLVDQIVRLERIDQELPEVLERLGFVDPEIPHSNRTEVRRLPTALREYLRCLRKYGARPSVLRPASVSWNRVVAARHDALFSQDYERLGYEPMTHAEEL